MRLEVEAALVVDLAQAHDEPLVVRELEPRREVAVVVELRADDLVSGAPQTPGGTGESEIHRRHVRAERDLVDGRPQEARGGGVRLAHERIGPARRLERAAEVRVRLAQILRDRVDHRVGHLCAAGAVEERHRPVERAEARAHRLDARQDTCHVYAGLTVSDAPTKQSRSAFAIRSSGSLVRGSSCASMRTSIATNR